MKIRSLLAKQGMDLNYEQIVEERKNEYPKPRDLDKKLRETIAPFRWLSEHGKYSLSLDAGLLNQDSFTKYGMLGLVLFALQEVPYMLMPFLKLKTNPIMNMQESFVFLDVFLMEFYFYLCILLMFFAA